jgi:hypothetical protein
MEKVYFTNSKGDKLCGILSNPKGDHLLPAVILCHGFTTSKDSATSTKLEEILNQKIIATFRFDFFGHGESEGAFSKITISEGVDDILQAIDYLKALGYSKIGLFGSSFGGICAIMAASKTKDLYLLTLKSPVSNYKERDLEIKSKEELAEWRKQGYRSYIDGKGKKHKLNHSFFRDYNNNDGYKAAEKINIPTLIVHGNKDESVPVKQSVKLNEILWKGTLEIIPGANHHYSGKGHFDRMIGLVSNFIIKNSL